MHQLFFCVMTFLLAGKRDRCVHNRFFEWWERIFYIVFFDKLWKAPPVNDFLRRREPDKMSVPIVKKRRRLFKKTKMVSWESAALGHLFRHVSKHFFPTETD
jgi:hypothetical protein